MPVGRPPMTCDSINERTFRRKKPETIKRAQHKKCNSRINHNHKPCEIKDDRCRDKIKVKTIDCGQVRRKQGEPFETYKKRCKGSISSKTKTACVVAAKKPNRCHAPKK
jgi:hypothetical protein